MLIRYPQFRVNNDPTSYLSLRSIYLSANLRLGTMLSAVALISVQGYAPSASVAPAVGASRSAARFMRMGAPEAGTGTFSEDLGIPCEGDCEAVYSKLPASVKPGVVTGQALVDLLDYAKARRPEQPSHHTTAAHALFCLLSVHRRL